METREQLLEQCSYWAGKYSEADSRLKELLRPVSDIKGEAELADLFITAEGLVEFEKAEKDISRALVKLHQIIRKLYKLK